MSASHSPKAEASQNAIKQGGIAPVSNWRLIGRMLLLGWRHRSLSLLTLILNIVLVAMGLASLGLAGLGIDTLREALQPGSPPPQWPLGIQPPQAWSPYSKTLLVAGLVLIAALLHAALKFVSAVANAALSQRILIQLRTEVYDKLQRLSFRFFDSHDSSSIINRVAGDVQAVRGFVDGVIVKVLTVGLSLAVYLGYMLSVHPRLAIACLFASPLIGVGAAWFSKVVRPLYRRSSELGDKLVLRLSENVQGIQVVKGFAREEDEIDRFQSANRDVRAQKHDIFWRLSVYQPIMGFLTQINQLVLIGYGGTLVIRGELPLGAGLFVFANLIHEFANQVGQIINIASTIQSSLNGAERVFAVLDADVEIASAENALRLERIRGRIVFEDVSFAYPTPPDHESADAEATKDHVDEEGTNQEPPEPAHQEIDYALKDVSFVIEPGECIGITGATGSGKTTLLNLIARFYDVTSGRVLVDDVDVRQIELQDLRRGIGLVFQESFLFSNTVAANVAFGQPGAEMARVEEAARQADAHEFIAELPEGYDSLIGEHGSNLSGGQRQRLAIARALLLDPGILLLDDATAAVDAETEEHIQSAIAQVQHGRTTLIVSHRTSTLQRTDRIYVLAAGHVVESGTHAQLMALDGEYAKQVKTQLGK